MKRLWMVRHGPTHARSMVGWSDLPADLSDTAALSRLSDHLPNAPVVSSDLIRAAATADAIQSDRPRLPHVPDLREINFGTWELRRFSEIEAEDPDRIRAYWDQPGDITAPGGECWNGLTCRVHAALDRLLAAHDDLVVVAHFGVILAQIQRALDLSAYEAFGHRIDNLSVTAFERAESWKVGAINHVP